MSNLEYAVQVVSGGRTFVGKICVKGDTEEEFWTTDYAEVEDYAQYLSADHGDIYKIISREKKNVTEPVEQDSEHRHPHADMIIEWAKDTSKVVEYYDDYIGIWEESETPSWNNSTQYRFQPPKPERVFPTTSLTEEELQHIYFNAPVSSSKESYKYIANAAIKQYILDIEKANDKT